MNVDGWRRVYRDREKSGSHRADSAFNRVFRFVIWDSTGCGVSGRSIFSVRAAQMSYDRVRGYPSHCFSVLSRSDTTGGRPSPGRCFGRSVFLCASIRCGAFSYPARPWRRLRNNGSVDGSRPGEINKVGTLSCACARARELVSAGPSQSVDGGIYTRASVCARCACALC